MMSENLTLPFTLEDVYGGLGEGNGLLHFDGETFRLEFEASVLGLWDMGVQDIAVPLDDLVQIECKRGWFSTTLKLQGKSLRTFEKIPGSKQGNLLLTIKRDSRSQAEHLASLVETKMTTRQLERLKDDLNSI